MGEPMSKARERAEQVCNRITRASEAYDMDQVQELVTEAEGIIQAALDAERERCVDKVQAFFMNPPGDLDKFLAPSIAYTCRGFLVKAIRAGEEEDA
jgi:hypothetical protein